MSRFASLLVLTIGISMSAHAAKQVTVEQLERLLAATHGQSDGKVARQLAGLELTERASSARLAHWKAQFPKRRSHEALTELADGSAFLNLPAADMPANPPPPLEAQKAMLAKTVKYVSTTVTRLPNFYATRKTEHFEDTPSSQGLYQNGRTGMAPGLGAALDTVNRQPGYVSMHSAGKSSVTVSYRDGYELTNSKLPNIGAETRPTAALSTVGEFGPILSLVLQDVTHGAIRWGHWEQGAKGMEAVFRYTVPEGKSGYRVTLPLGTHNLVVNPAYHGEIAVDPDSGSILRITVVSDFTAPYQNTYTAILVEYGDVALGGTTYNCPLKGVAISRMPPLKPGGGLDFAAPVRMQMNDVAFTQYHLFRAEARMVPVTGDSDGAPPSPPR